MSQPYTCVRESRGVDHAWCGANAAGLHPRLALKGFHGHAPKRARCRAARHVHVLVCVSTCATAASDGSGALRRPSTYAFLLSLGHGFLLCVLLWVGWLVPLPPWPSSRPSSTFTLSLRIPRRGRAYREAAGAAGGRRAVRRRTGCHRTGPAVVASPRPRGLIGARRSARGG